MCLATMDNLNQVYESDEGEGEFYALRGGRLGGLGEAGEVEIINNEGNLGDINLGDEYLEEGNEGEEGSSDEMEVREVRENQQDIGLIQALPPFPFFEPYKHPRPPHKQILNLPQEFSGQSPFSHMRKTGSFGHITHRTASMSIAWGNTEEGFGKL